MPTAAGTSQVSYTAQSRFHRRTNITTCCSSGLTITSHTTNQTSIQSVRCCRHFPSFRLSQRLPLKSNLTTKDTRKPNHYQTHTTQAVEDLWEVPKNLIVQRRHRKRMSTLALLPSPLPNSSPIRAPCSKTYMQVLKSRSTPQQQLTPCVTSLLFTNIQSTSTG